MLVGTQAVVGKPPAVVALVVRCKTAWLAVAVEPERSATGMVVLVVVVGILAAVVGILAAAPAQPLERT